MFMILELCADIFLCEKVGCCEEKSTSRSVSAGGKVLTGLVPSEYLLTKIVYLPDL